MKKKKKSQDQALQQTQCETETPCPERAKCPIVGLGASAGGLDAFKQFLDHMPPNSGMAFVLVQHLDPHHESLMPELLAKHTAMPVKRLEDNDSVEANHIYVTPANAVILMERCTFRIRPLPAPGSRRLPIDEFFRSLARDQGENVIGIVLSGTGTDGTLGLRAIKQEGGLTIAQVPEAAEYDSMPRSAIAAGVVDHVLPVQQMPGVILEYIRHVIHLQGQTSAEAAQVKTAKALSQVFPLLHRATGHDFSHYKQSTLLRRLQRRMQVTYSPSLDAYVQLLQSTPREAQELFKDLLIGVTQFFRDPEAFDTLADKVLPEIFRDKSTDVPVRVWIPGCATGEEAYSLAMLLAEYISSNHLRHRVQIFATDIDDEALEAARKAQYPESIREHMPTAEWTKYFVRRDSTWEVTEQIREMCIFSLHNLIKDPPFLRLDLISCRNLLIYMEAELQRNLLPLFHYALNPSGFLFLGPSENVAARSELFRLAHKKHRIFQRKPSLLRPTVKVPAFSLERGYRFQAPLAALAPMPKEQTVVRSIERVLLEELAP
ncbi:MAG TPA: chemotaxis protein CheB, partial [Verrucomicrobiae bacterium]|nr:chemotaxis protein CheB [Verrucomicrobiae bacterium]